MLRYKLIEHKNGRYLYEYVPEGHLRPGLLALHENGEREIVKDSEDDYAGIYRGQAFCGIDITKEEGTVAWY